MRNKASLLVQEAGGAGNQKKGVSTDVELERGLDGVGQAYLIVELIKYVMYESGLISMPFDQILQLRKHQSNQDDKSEAQKLSYVPLKAMNGRTTASLRPMKPGGRSAIEPDTAFILSTEGLFSTITNILSNPQSFYSFNQILLLLGPAPNTNPRHALMINLPQLSPCCIEQETTSKSVKALLRTLIVEDFLHSAKISSSSGPTTLLSVMISAPRGSAAEYSSAGLLPCLSFNLSSLQRIGINSINCSVKPNQDVGGVRDGESLEGVELSICELLSDISGIEPFSPCVNSAFSAFSHASKATIKSHDFCHGKASESASTPYYSRTGSQGQVSRNNASELYTEIGSTINTSVKANNLCFGQGSESSSSFYNDGLGSHGSLCSSDGGILSNGSGSTIKMNVGEHEGLEKSSKMELVLKSPSGSNHAEHSKISVARSECVPSKLSCNNHSSLNNDDGKVQLSRTLLKRFHQSSSNVDTPTTSNELQKLSLMVIPHEHNGRVSCEAVNSAKIGNSTEIVLDSVRNFDTSLMTSEKVVRHSLTVIDDSQLIDADKTSQTAVVNIGVTNNVSIGQRKIETTELAKSDDCGLMAFYNAGLSKIDNSGLSTFNKTGLSNFDCAELTAYDNTGSIRNDSIGFTETKNFVQSDANNLGLVSIDNSIVVNDLISTMNATSITEHNIIEDIIWYKITANVKGFTYSSK